MRIGNLFLDGEGNVQRCCGIFEKTAEDPARVYYGTQGKSTEEFYGVEITDARLITLGFKYEEWEGFCEGMNTYIGKQKGWVIDRVYCFIIFGDDANPRYFGRRNTNPRIKKDHWNFTEYAQPKFIHELQNALFVECGKELQYAG